MHRILILILVSSIAKAQGIGDFAILENSTDEKLFHSFISKAREDGDTTKVIIIRSLLGRLHCHQQQYDLAEKELLLSLKQIDQFKSAIRPSAKMAGLTIYDTFDYLGELYEHTADYARAEFYYKESEKIRATQFQKGSFFRIFNTQNLASFYLDTEQWSLAGLYLRKLNDELNRTKYNNEKLKGSYAVYYKGMTQLSIELKQLEQAKYFFKQTVKFYASPFTSYRGALRYTLTPEVELLQSKLLLLEGRYKESEENSAAMIQGRTADSIRLLPEFLRASIECYWAEQKFTEAMNTTEQLLQLDLVNLRKLFHFLNDGEKEQYARVVDGDMELYCTLLTQNETYLHDPVRLESLFQFRMQTKALLLNEILTMKKQLALSHDSALQSQYRKLAYLKNKESVEAFRKGSKRDLSGISRQIDDLEKNIYSKLSSKNENRGEENFSTGNVKSNLSAGEAAIEVIRFKAPVVMRKTKSDSIYYLILALDHQSLKPIVLNNGSLLEGRMANYFRNAIKLDRDTISYRHFWKDVGNSLEATSKRIYFSGDGVFNQINLNLLWNENKFLIDRYDFVLLTNLMDLPNVKENISTSKGKGFLFGRPQYSFVPTTQEVKATETTRAIRAMSLNELKGEEFSDLPATEKEITLASNILKQSGWTVKAYLGVEATETKLKELISPQLIHIATHGFFIQESWAANPMLKSGLIFAGVKNEIITDEDGILTAREASELQLRNTSLVVLSACETGLGEVKNGEGVYGLQRAFLIAGAKNIIMSLWKVDDEATQKLMTLFYENYATTLDVRTSFAKAQQLLRQDYPEPYYWGAFVLIEN
ncbi:MAG TPA: CHAT domain-containing tetratricopeptide repeat protein [Cyclobacteriaceae bacterium]|jgi:CHAT domain-containing protein|nr:CHAT domain-containing tetratricopeptide repeat protein [Cyclobacteriaceae bacterium]